MNSRNGAKASMLFDSREAMGVCDASSLRRRRRRNRISGFNMSPYGSIRHLRLLPECCELV